MLQIQNSYVDFLKSSVYFLKISKPPLFKLDQTILHDCKKYVATFLERKLFLMLTWPFAESATLFRKLVQVVFETLTWEMRYLEAKLFGELVQVIFLKPLSEKNPSENRI